MGFQEKDMGDYYIKDFGEFSMAVDFDNKVLYYPKDVTINDKTTSNFSHNENFVVFECVNRLIVKGYRPEDIELEPKWRLGHESKTSGKPDILIKDRNGDNLIIIECKTAGKEYRKEKKNTEADGGQLFSYWQQDSGIKWLALYASDWDNGEIKYQNDVINCTDDANIKKMAERDKDVKVFAKAKTDTDKYEAWRDTYNCQWLPDILFSEDSLAYQIQVKPLRKKDLKDFTPDDKIVNQFEEILRHNNVSDKENAFNRLVALFICKLVDEIKKQDDLEVDFQYKYTDTYESLQDRLQQLHKQGMEEFMKEKIFYVPDDYAERLFVDYTGQKRNAAIANLQKTIRILKFYSNNDFAFKDVHNEELFYQNGKILVEVVQLFQPYRIVYPSKHQFLGDLFEQLLNKGFKQNEGQFFTPTPITRFIWDSLPLNNYIENHDIPRVLDYACGAGHFLTEGVEAINAIRPNEDNSWVENHIYGVEKDYRLARVSKVSMFMNGAGGSNIVFGDGLENYPEKGIEPHSFDILVANPPYAVSGFKRHLALHHNSFHILDKITLNGSEIETLFVERIAQVLKPEGIAAVILPASILSNGASASYTAARGDLLQNFKLHAIVSFGSKTFGATRTNTVTLFVEKYDEPPRKAEMVNDFVNAVIDDNVQKDWRDEPLFLHYLEHQHISKEVYRNFINRNLDWTKLAADKYLKTYVDDFNTKQIAIPKNLKTVKEIEDYRLRRFYDEAIAVERQKLYYFALVDEQETLVITSPSDNKAQQEFLGYDWSNRKGDEGIKINNPGGKLYNDDDRFARGTLACAIRNSFIGAHTQLSEDLQQYAKWYLLKDMIEFSTADFNLYIKINAIKKIVVTYKYPLVKLGGNQGVCKILIGGTPSRDNYAFYEGGNNLWVSIAEMKGQVINDTKEKITDEAVRQSNVKLIPKETTLLSFKLSIGKTAFTGKDLYTNEAIAALTPKDKGKVMDKYLFYLFSGNSVNLTNVGNKAFGKSLNSSYLNNEVQIPLPPIAVQQQIVSECEAEDRVYAESTKRLQEISEKTEHLLDESKSMPHHQTLQLSDPKIFEIHIGKRVLKNDVAADGEYDVYSANVFTPFGKTETSVLDDFSKPSVLWGIDGDWMVNCLKAGYKFNPTDHCGVIRVLDESKVLPRYLAYVLDEEGRRQRFS